MHRQSKLAGYKINSSQSKDGSRNLATLKKDLFVTVVNEKLKNVHSCLKTLILDAIRFLGPSLKLSNHNC